MSGGQTGVDRGALDAARQRGIAVGGWCPKGRWAEDGPIPDRYPLRETAGSAPEERTLRNVVESDASLVLTWGPPAGGTALTIRHARDAGRPLRVLDLMTMPATVTVSRWLRGAGVRVLNVAGPRESEAPGVQARARDFVAELLGDTGLSHHTPRDPSG